MYASCQCNDIITICSVFINIRLKKEPLNKKDKILNCNIAADCICMPSVR